MPYSFELKSDFGPKGDQLSAISKLVSGVKAGERFQTLLGVTGSGKTFTIANVIAKTERASLIIAPNKTLAAQLYSEMKAFFPHNAVEYFVSYYDYYQPEAYVVASDTYIEKDASINDQIEQMRLAATKSLLERKDVIIVASVSAIYGLGDPESYMAMLLNVQVGEQISQRKILKRLSEMQYTRNDVTLSRGNFRVKGEVIDIFPADSEEKCLRIELFDEEIERLAWFDALTGEYLEFITRVTIYPQTHFVTPKSRILSIIDDIKADLSVRRKELLQASKFVEEQRLSERVRMDIEMMSELGYCSGIENYSRYLSGRKVGEAPPTLLDYLPKNALIILDESHVSVGQIGGMYYGDRSRKKTLVEFGFRLPSALDNRPLSFTEFEKKIHQAIFVSATPAKYEIEHSKYVVSQILRPTGLLDPMVEVRPVSTQVDDLLSEIKKRALLNERVFAVTLTKRMAEQLTDYLSEHGARVRYLHSDIDTIERVELIRTLRLGEFDTLVGINLLREGLDVPEVSLVAILDADKEGFLRSERSLIQTIGRASRNINGKAILYADTITKSMQAAMTKTAKRRTQQESFNKKNHIYPKTISKPIVRILDVCLDENISLKQKNLLGKKSTTKQKEAQQIYTRLSPVAFKEKLKQLEKEMYQHSGMLEFEKAADVRDQIKLLKQANLNS